MSLYLRRHRVLALRHDNGPGRLKGGSNLCALLRAMEGNEAEVHNAVMTEGGEASTLIFAFGVKCTRSLMRQWELEYHDGVRLK